MDRTIYSKYSNERAAQFCIRTDIVSEESGVKTVYKHALAPEGRRHIRQIAEAYRKLSWAYEGSGIFFCPCREAERLEREKEKDGACYVAFPFLRGTSLQAVLERAVQEADQAAVEGILREYVLRMSQAGGEVPFAMTPGFTEVFGMTRAEWEAAFPEQEFVCAAVSDIDMIFSNVLLEAGETAGTGGRWQVIDYEWTFDFPVPKAFVIYRAIYFAYYQSLNGAGWSIPSLLALAGITEEQAAVFGRMEEHFQEYLGGGVLPVRNMQRVFRTDIVPFARLLEADGVKGAGSGSIQEVGGLPVRKLQYHIDRQEKQDGSVICSGWAFARTWDGRCLPVNIRILDADGREVPAEIERRERSDVAKALKIRNVTAPAWGFDCVWIAPPDAGWKVHFSLGKKECLYET